MVVVLFFMEKVRDLGNFIVIVYDYPVDFMGVIRQARVGKMCYGIVVHIYLKRVNVKVDVFLNVAIHMDRAHALYLASVKRVTV
ncbi:hypothetical protein DGG96_07320 [Legionella qingyii]|uniref:Uncharacterized protein n=1 Tax=Legionella qingyii TaxID=2184757 RepID=A0A317U623_9GAMM|nr:hypothetical protein DGG96_07320 [Legionella qingyii]